MDASAQQPDTCPMTFDDFIAWEQSNQQTIDFKIAYVDIAGDLHAGLLLSQIIYWHLPSKTGQSRLRVSKDGRPWLVKGYDDWWAEIRLTAKQSRRSITILRNKQIIETRVMRFNGFPYCHVWLNKDVFMQRWTDIVRSAPEGRTVLPSGAERNALQGRTECPTGQNRSAPEGRTLTETTDRDYRQRLPSENNNNRRKKKPVAAAVDQALKTELMKLGIGEPVLTELASQSIPLEEVAAWLEYQRQNNHLGPGFFVARLRVGDKPPAARPANGGDDPDRYIKGKYADYIQR